VQHPDDLAHEMTEAFIRVDSTISSKEEEIADHLDGYKLETMTE